MELNYEFMVDSRDVDNRNQARPSAVLGYLQEAAVEASVEMKVDRDRVVAKYSCFWMLVRIWVSLKRPLRFGEHLTVTTWHRDGKGASLYRDFDLTVDGENVGEAVSIWVLASLSDRKLMRMSSIEECSKVNAGGERCKEKTIANLRHPDKLEKTDERKLYYSDTDINGHVNNIHYADFACDALHLEHMTKEEYVSEWQVCYLSECQCGETLELLTGSHEDGGFVLGQDKEGKNRFTAVLKRSKLN